MIGIHLPMRLPPYIATYVFHNVYDKKNPTTHPRTWRWNIGYLERDQNVVRVLPLWLKWCVYHRVISDSVVSTVCSLPVLTERFYRNRCWMNFVVIGDTGLSITTTIWRWPFGQWQCSFQMKAALPLANKRPAIASYRCQSTGHWRLSLWQLLVSPRRTKLTSFRFLS